MCFTGFYAGLEYGAACEYGFFCAEDFSFFGAEGEFDFVGSWLGELVGDDSSIVVFIAVSEIPMVVLYSVISVYFTGGSIEGDF